ncbi:hypothetical protein Tco_1136580 [Tanacetum coccineum]
MKISSFMDSVKSPELAKRFASNVPKTVEEMMKRSRDVHQRLTFPDSISERATIEILTRPETTSIHEDIEITEIHTHKRSKQTEPYRIGKAESLDERPEAEGGKETKQKPSSAEGEVAKPLGKIDLEVLVGNKGLSRRTSMKFIIIRAPSPYNVILGRPGLKILHAIPSTIHSRIKFPTPKGIATLIARTITIAE